MKKILITLFVISMLAVSLGFVFAAKPTKIENGVEVGWMKSECTTIQSGELYASDDSLITTGYDQWGYNYQAHMFNGYYCNAYRNADWCQPWVDVNLMMKWNDAWLANVDCDGDGLLDRHYNHPSYIGSGAWLTNHQSGSYLSNWDITGDWVVLAAGVNSHDMFITTQNPDGSFEGYGGYPSGDDEYTHEWIIVNGQINGDSIQMTWDYHKPVGTTYGADFEGTIDQDGKMSGTFYDTSGHVDYVWETTSGTATGQICNWNYFVKIVAAPADAYPEGGIWYAADGTEIGPSIWGAFAIIQQVENDACAGIHGSQYLSPVRAGLGNW